MSPGAPPAAGPPPPGLNLSPYVDGLVTWLNTLSLDNEAKLAILAAALGRGAAVACPGGGGTLDRALIHYATVAREVAEVWLPAPAPPGPGTPRPGG